MSEIKIYKGFTYIVNTDDGKTSYVWNGKTYLRFYELCADIDNFLNK